MKNRKPKADGRYVVNVSFTANETSLLSWADNHGNFSTYVKKLIEADMNKAEMTAGIPTELLQKMLLNMMGQNVLKDNIQNKGIDEISATVDVDKEEPPKKEKKKINKLAVNNIMKKK